jgi:hypothetical protein
MLPYIYDLYAFSTELLSILFVAFFVSEYLRFPKQTTCLWVMTTFGTAMPKTAVDKNGKTLFAEKEIRFASKIFSVGLPSFDSCPNKRHSETKLSGSIIFAANGRHCLRTYGRNIFELSALECLSKLPFHLSNTYCLVPLKESPFVCATI